MSAKFAIERQRAEAATITREPLRTREQAAEYLGVKSQTLAVWKSTGRYPLPCVKVGNKAMYRQSDLEKFCAERTVGGESGGEQ